MSLITALGLLLAAAWCLQAALYRRASRQVRPLAGVLTEGFPGAAGAAGPAPDPGAPPAPLPRLTIVITARDEAATIEATVRHALGQVYPGLEVVAVDDRSNDGTGDLLDRMAAGDPGGRLAVVHVRDLPPRWLGKCHACHVGSRRGRGEFLLFMDGDVTLSAPDLLARTMRVVEAGRIDHLAIFPDLRPMGRLQAAVVHSFEQGMLLAMRAWEMESDRSRGGAGIGAFNLVRRDLYEKVGGHERLRMEIADDFKLGVLLRAAGARQRLWSGLDLVRCPWHRGAFAVLRGLEKNLFAGAEYSIARLLAYTGAVILMWCGPVAIAILGSGPAAFVPLAAQVAAVALTALSGAPRLGRSALVVGALQPLSMLLMTGAFWNSAIRTLAQGGVRWRGTFYPLADLRRGVVR